MAVDQEARTFGGMMSIGRGAVDQFGWTTATGTLRTFGTFSGALWTTAVLHESVSGQPVHGDLVVHMYALVARVVQPLVVLKVVANLVIPRHPVAGRRFLISLTVGLAHGVAATIVA